MFSRFFSTVALMATVVVACADAPVAPHDPTAALGRGNGNGNGGGGPPPPPPPPPAEVLGTLTFGGAADDVYTSDTGDPYQVQVSPTVRIVTGSGSFTPENQNRCVSVQISGLFQDSCTDLGMVEKLKTDDDFMIHEMSENASGFVRLNSWFADGKWNLKYGMACPDRWGDAGDPDDSTRASIQAHGDTDGDGLADSWTITASVGNVCQKGQGRSVIVHAAHSAPISFTLDKDAG